MEQERTFAKNLADRKLSGVCAGIADYFNVDRNLVRLVTLLLVVFTGGAGFLGYILAALFMPVREADRALGRKTSLLSVVFVIVLVGAVIGLFVR